MTELNLDQLRDVINYTIKNNQYLQTQGKVPIAINIEADAGIGKTSLIDQIAKENGLQLVKINLSQIEELGDLVGFPIKEYHISSPDGSTEKWVNEHEMALAIKHGYVVKGHQMSYAKPEWINRIEDGAIILFDDYTRANPIYMQATMEIIDRQEYISWKLPKNCHIILTTNPDGLDYNVTSLDAAQKTRFVSVKAKFDVDVWARWAEKQGIDSRCINFILFHPEIITKGNNVNARIASTFFNSIMSIPDFEKELPMIKMLGTGSIGDIASTEFVMFINNKLDKLIAPSEILSPKFTHETIINKLDDCIGTRIDISAVLTLRIINFASVLSGKTVAELKDLGYDKKFILERIEKIVLDCESLTEDQKYMIIKELYKNNKVFFADLTRNPEFAKIIIKI